MSATIEMADLSHHNGPSIDFHALKAAGLGGVFLKASEGPTEVDPLFAHYREAAHSAGLLISPYHYFRPGGTAVAQAKHFLGVVGSFHGLLPPALDVELNADERPGVSPSAYTHGMAAWIAVIEHELGVKPFVYSYLDFWRWLGNPEVFGDCLLWKASYPHLGTPLAGWKKVSVHQYTSSGTIAGHSGIDRDRFLGDAAALRALVIKET